MNRNAIILVVIVAIVLGVLAFRMITKETVVAESIEDIQKREGIPVHATVLQPEPFERWRLFSGSIEGKKQAPLYANIPARIRAVKAKQGDKVYRGKSIIELDPLSASQSYAALQTSRLQLADAKRMLDRMKPLYEAGAVSQEDFDRVKSGYEMAKAGYTDTSHMIRLTSPIKGVLTDLRVSPGDKVDPGQTVAVVADLSGIKVVLDVSQSDVEELVVGQKLVVGNSAEDRKKSCEGCSVAKISLSADAESRLFRVEGNLGADSSARPGTLRYVQVRTYLRDDALSVPVGAVIEHSGEFFVYVATPQGTAEKRALVLGKRNDFGAEVLSGLSPGDTVVTWGQNRLKGGEKLKVVSDKKAEIAADNTETE
jgi:RND family efflux transporter MFP subunit